MIQYYHFHSSKGEYKDLISQSYAPESQNRLKIFSELSALKRDKDTCFTYCPYEGDCYFLQTNTTNNAFCHGLMGKVKDLNIDPTLYIDRFDVRYRYYDEDSIGDAPLPSGKVFNTALYGGLPKIFGDVLETLIYSNKLVILLDASKETLIKFVQGLFRLLPNKYRRTIGFCIAPDSVEPFLPGSITEVFKSIRLIAVTSTSFYPQDNMAVFDFSKCNKSSLSLHEYGSAIEAYAEDVGSDEVLAFVNRVDSRAVNDEGSIDFAAMNGIAQTVLLKKDPSEKNCIYMLENMHEYREFDEALAFAVKTLLSVGNPSTENLKLIENTISQVDIKNTEGASAARVAYGEYIVASISDWRFASDFMLSCFIEYFKNLSTPDRNKLLENAERSKRNKDSFNTLVHLYIETEYQEDILKLILCYVNPDVLYDGNIDYSEDAFDDEKNIKAFTDCLFLIAGSIENAEDAKRIVATLIVGCVCGRIAKEKRELRKESVKTFLDFGVKIVDGKKTNKKLFSSSLKKIEYLIDIYDYYMLCVHILGEEATRDESTIKEIAEVLIDDLSFSDCLYLYNKYSKIGFDCIRNLIYSRLSNFDTVKREILKGDNYLRYKKFIEKEKAVLADGEQISNYVLSMTDAQIREGMRKELDSFRQSFNNRCYKYTGPKATAWIIKEVNQVNQTDVRIGVQDRSKVCVYNDERADALMSEELPADAPFEKRLQKQVFSEKLFLALGNKSEIEVKNNSTERFRMYSLIAVCSLAYMLLLTLVFFVPQIVYSVLLECNFVDRALAMLDPVQILFIVYAGMVGAVSGLTLWKSTKHDRPTSLKICNLSMFIFAVVPALCYEIAFSIMYVMK